MAAPTQPPLFSSPTISPKPNQTTIQVFPSNSILERGMNYNNPSAVANPPTSMPISSAVGFRFHPTNEELVSDYLVPKMMGDVSEDILIIPEVHVCRHEPWDLPDKYSNLSSDDQVGYFFCPRDFKYLKSRRSNRRTRSGYWKPTGKKIVIKDKRIKKIIGIKKTLVFYKTATPKDERTGWIIHEYEVLNDSIDSNQAEYVLCKLKKKLDNKNNKGDANHLVASDFENQNSDQNSDEVMTDLPHKASMSSMENQNSSMLVSDLAHGQSGSAMASYGETQRSNDLIANSASKGSEGSCPMISDLEYNSLVNMISTSPYENWFVDSDFEDQVSPPFQLEGKYGPSIDIPSNLMNHSTCGKGESGSSTTSDFERQVLEKETEISGPNGDERNYLPSNSDLLIQIPREKTDMSILEQGSSDNLVASDPENYSTEAMSPDFPQLTREELAELLEELENCHSSPLQPPKFWSTEETPSYMGFGASVST